MKTTGREVKRRLPIGAEPATEGGVHFRVWAPAHREVTAVYGIGTDAARGQIALTPEKGGYFSGFAPDAAAGMRYGYRLGEGEMIYPDPASRFQPDGPHGLSEVVNPSAFEWSDRSWSGVELRGQVLYEMHVGTFTREGTWMAAANEIERLADLGVTVIEVMPVAEFPGRFGWGYDGVNLFAPTRLYGAPDEFRAFVNRAHEAGLGVILDVVYNHLGPDGNYLKEFSPDYFTQKYKNEWGEPLNFDGGQEPVREFFRSNARYWIDEFRLDGLRLDATQQVFDSTIPHILEEIGRESRAAAGGRFVVLIAENEPQEVKLVMPREQGGFGLDGIWNDDFHHAAVVAACGRREAYYSDYNGSPQEFVSLAKHGFLFQGQRYKWQKKRRGSASLRLAPWQMISYIENHDQVANSLKGERLHQLTSRAKYRALTAYFLLSPATPMLFQGQEYASDRPFLYFADHNEKLARAVRAGREEFLSQFPSLALDASKAMIHAPEREATFRACKLDSGDRKERAWADALHRDLIGLRRNDPVIGQQRYRGVDGAVISPDAFLLRYFDERFGDRSLLVNLGKDLHLDPAPEPLLAPPEECHWNMVWSSEDHRYGGYGTPRVESEENWRLPAESAVLLFAKKGREHGDVDPADRLEAGAGGEPA